MFCSLWEEWKHLEGKFGGKALITHQEAAQVPTAKPSPRHRALNWNKLIHNSEGFHPRLFCFIENRKLRLYYSYINFKLPSYQRLEEIWRNPWGISGDPDGHEHSDEVSWYRNPDNKSLNWDFFFLCWENRMDFIIQGLLRVRALMASLSSVGRDSVWKQRKPLMALSTSLIFIP